MPILLRGAVDRHDLSMTSPDWVETYYRDGLWHNRVSGADQPEAPALNTEDGAVARGRELARSFGQQLTSGVCEHRVKGVDGAIAYANCYPEERDPRRTRT